MSVLRKFVFTVATAATVFAAPSIALATTGQPAMTATVQANASGTATQVDIPAQGHYYIIKNKLTGYCIGVASHSVNSHELDAPCRSNDRNQEWYLGPRVSQGALGWYLLKNRASGLCVGLGHEYAIQFPCSTQRPGQQWRQVTRTHIGNYYPWANRETGNCLGLRSTVEYAKVIDSRCTSSHEAQFWKFIRI